VSYLLVGGLNYFLRHKPVTTQDIDLLIDDTPQNRRLCEIALVELGAEWGRRDEDWGSVSAKPNGWLSGQSVFCLLTRFGPVDIFLSIPGISNFSEARLRSVLFEIDPSTQVRLISTVDLLACQFAIPEIYRKRERIAHLQGIIANGQ
jgi:hypothetical protein